MDGSPASIGKALQVLNEQLPEKVKVAASLPSWVFLTTLHRSMEEALAETARVQDLRSQQKALESQVCQVEEKLRGRGSEAEAPPESLAEDMGEVEVVHQPQVQPIMHQKVNHEPPLGPRSIAASNPVVTEFTAYPPYTPMELWELGKQCRQCSREQIPAWLLCLWDKGADSIICSAGEMEKLASGTVHPSLRQRLQNCRWMAQGQGNHSLMDGSLLQCAVWDEAGKLPENVSKWQSYTKLVQIIREMGTRHATFDFDTQGPGDEQFPTSMRNLVWDSAPKVPLDRHLCALCRAANPLSYHSGHSERC